MGIALGECVDGFLEETACCSMLENDGVVQTGIHPT